ncbi:beta-fructofuranosidase [Anaerotaenia torta]|uniref:GH32 C-terminal domain-containing protein n=1 Tax=Anaerotaenia torta TaxID=433293 RepID=UPI003D200A33
MLYYKAQDGVTADIIPYYENGHFYLFYLHDFRDKANKGEGTPWRLIRTKDFIEYEEFGEVLPRGTVQEQDLYVFTGSVFKEAEGKYHIFYTGHNPHLREQGHPEQAVMHAISPDLIHWEKVKEDTFYAPAKDYEVHDWRDPFVYLDEEKGCYWMLLAARLRQGDKVKRGCTALCSSKDLKTWKVEEPLWSPDAFFTHECPDLFRMNRENYLVYSEFTDRCVTRYRVSDTEENCWRSTEDDAFDGRAFYAAKTASDGGKRYVFGWVPTKAGDNDDGEWQWGGNLMVHEVFQRKDRSLGCRIPETIKNHIKTLYYSEDRICCGNEQGFASRTLTKVEADTYRISADIIISRNNVNAGILLRHDAEEDFAYGYKLETSNNRFAFGMVPNTPWGRANFTNVERPVPFIPGTRYHLDIVVEGDVCVLYLDGVALSSRMYIKKDNGISIYSENGEVRLENVEVFTV